MTAYTLTVEGPRPITRHLSAHDEEGALDLLDAEIRDAYGDEGDPAVLQAQVSLRTEDGIRYQATVAQTLGRTA